MKTHDHIVKIHRKAVGKKKCQTERHRGCGFKEKRDFGGGGLGPAVAEVFMKKKKKKQKIRGPRTIGNPGKIKSWRKRKKRWQQRMVTLGTIRKETEFGDAGGVGRRCEDRNRGGPLRIGNKFGKQTIRNRGFVCMLEGWLGREKKKRIRKKRCI